MTTELFFRRNARPAASALLCCTALFLTSPAFGQGPPPAPVRVEAVRLEKVQERQLVTGEVRAVRRSTVAAEEAGQVLEMKGREGTRIGEGDVIARLDRGRLELDLAIAEAERVAAEAAVAEREESLSQTRRDFDTLTDLAGRGAANPKELADSETDWKVAQRRLALARKNVEVAASRIDLLNKRIGDMDIRAPFEGVVIKTLTEAGQWVGTGDGIVELLATDELEAWLDVPQNLLPALRRRSESVVLAIGEGFVEVDAAACRIIPDVDTQARTFVLVACLPPRDNVVPGMSVSARVATGETAEHLTVPADAVLRNETGPYLYRVAGGGPEAPAQALFTPVEPLFQEGSRLVVRSGALSAGDRVIVEGNERVFPGMPVRPMDSLAPAGEAPAAPGP